MSRPVGKLDDPDFRKQRARDAALARTTPDYHLDALIKATVDGMAPLTEDQLSKLATLLTSGRRMT